MCFLSELGWVYDLSQPDILQLYGLSEVCTCECFFRSELLANLRSHPSYSHLNGFSPAKTPKKHVVITRWYARERSKRRKIIRIIRYRIPHKRAVERERTMHTVRLLKCLIYYARENTTKPGNNAYCKLSYWFCFENGPGEPSAEDGIFRNKKSDPL